ncbi:MAG TPA: hypothetical protein VK507_22430 [Iamia sp.]|nr:hypothetical protein [Iamia sp.]
MDDTTDRPRAAPPTLVGVGSLLLGGLCVFAALVGYGLADHKYSGWERLSEGESFGLSSALVGIAGVAFVILGLILLGVGIGTARREHHHHGQPGQPHPHLH